MKWLVIAGMLTPALLNVAASLTQYWLGYSESEAALITDALFGFCILELAGFLFVCTLAVPCFARRRCRIQAFLMILAYFPLLILFLKVLPAGGTLVVHGLRDRVMHDYSLDDLRHFAHEIDDAGLIKVGWINHGDNSGLTADQKTILERLQQHYPFMRWLGNGQVLTGPSLLNGGDKDEVDFEWGSELSGHWGCSIRLDGKRNDPPPGVFFPVLHVSDDIYFYFE